MTFYWWDDAIAHANSLTLWTLIRHKVTWTGGGWTVDLADADVVPDARIAELDHLEAARRLS